MIKVSIVYSWEDETHNNWVCSLANLLYENGMKVTLDKYDVLPGDRIPHFMEKAISNADFVLIICTPTYKGKYDNRIGGVGYEGNIIADELYSYGNERKFIPVLRKGNKDTSIPISLASKYYINLTDGDEARYKREINDLMITLQGKPKKPLADETTIGSKQTGPQQETTDDGLIQILGIIADRVTVPRMDGTYGSALYKIPFKLSKNPSDLWKKLFLEAWQSPPKFSTMHRPGIASVLGDNIILDGTTIEEVRDYHRDTLLLCVDMANKEEKEILESERKKQEQEELRKRKHIENVNDVAGKIRF